MFLLNFFKSELNNFVSSSREFTKLKSLTVSAMMVALYVVVSMLNIPITNLIQIRFTFIPLALSGMMFGPVVAMFVGGLGDILGYLIHPTGGALNLGITLCAILTGHVYGLVFYRRMNGIIANIVKVVTAALMVEGIISMFLKTYILHTMYGGTYFANLVSRIPVVTIMLCIQIVVLFFLNNLYKSILIKQLKLV